MKLILIDHEDHSEVQVRGSDGINLHVYTFDDHKQARSFCQGFTCARQVASAAVQSLPMIYELVPTPAAALKSVSQQLSHQWVGRA